MTEKVLDVGMVPPHSLEAEQSVLGGLMLDNTAWDRVADVVTEVDFYRTDHRLIYRHISRLIEHSKPADVVTVAEVLEATKDLPMVGGLPYLSALAGNTPSAANIRRYAEIVRERSRQRALAAIFRDAADRALVTATDPTELCQEVDAQLMAMLETRVGAGLEPLHRFVDRVLLERENPVQGLRFGLRDLDRLVPRGLRPGELTIVAARTGQGKSALVMQIAEHNAMQGIPVAVFSLEMTGEQLAERMLNRLTRSQDVRLALDYLAPLPVYIDASPAPSIATLRARARVDQRKRGTKLIIVDYLQLVDSKAENRNLEVAAISRGLKALTKDLGVPVIAAAQLSRNSEYRVGRRPVLTDLRDSGQIEQDADLVLMLFNDAADNPESPDAGLVELWVRKQRQGRTGMVVCAFDPSGPRFSDHDGPLPSSQMETKVARGRFAANAFDAKKAAAGDDQ